MGEPLDTDERTVQDLGSCLYVNPTNYAVKTLGIEVGDEVTIKTYPDRIEIIPDGDD